MALLELVDNPRDFKFEMTARAVGRELLTDKLRWNTPRGVLNNGVTGAHASVSDELQLKVSDKGQLRSMTRRNLQKVLRYRGREALADISQKATAHIVSPRVVQESRHSISPRSHFLLDLYYSTGHKWPRVREQRMPRLPIVRHSPRHLCVQDPRLLGKFDPLGNLPRVHSHGRAGSPRVAHALPRKVHPDLQLILYRICGFHELL